MQIGPYQVLEEVARGGNGVVYRARDAQGQLVALKLLLAQRTQNARARKRFRTEVDALARLRHPHVVPILGAGEHQGSPWLALEFVEGESLGARLRRGPLSIPDALRVAQQLAQALSYVHACGLLHRDLKPDNVLLRGDDALLTDFGLALDEQSTHSRVTASGMFLGTPGYWAPEQARGESSAHGVPTDLYGLGGVIYACLTGDSPVQAGSLQEYLQPVRFKAIQPPRAVRPEVPGWLSELCMTCLEVEPTARPASAEAVLRALVLGGDPLPTVAAPPARARALLALAGVLASLAVGLVLVWPTAPAPATAANDPVPAANDPVPAANDPAPAASDPPATERPAADDADAAAWVAEGVAHNLAGRHQLAIEAYTRALELDPDDALTYQKRGGSKANLDRDRDALDDYDRSIALDPKDPHTWAYRATSKVKLGRAEEALQDYAQALERDPDHVYALAYRGVHLANLGRHAEALEDYTRAIELDPDNAFAYRNRGGSKAGLGRHAEAIEDYTRAIELQPEGSYAYQQRGVSKAKLGRPAEAIADYDLALQVDPDNASAYRERGASLARLGRHAQAIADLTRAIELSPEEATAYAHRGVSRAKLDRHAEALADFDRTLELAPGTASIHAYRGECRRELGRLAEALEDYDRALALGLPSEGATERVRTARAQVAQQLARE